VNFFELQEAAQRSSRLLMLLFLVAIVSTIILANLAIYLILKFQSMGTFQFDQTLALEIAIGVVVLVLLGSLYRIYSLKRGGEAIAAALGGHLVINGGENDFERRLIHVVEEMAIASGLPVPPVYLIHEDGINAFAAGHGSGDAVIGITQGAILNLTRDQLQGVVAHEFSHILNGDMRLNIRLVGVLHGLLMLAIVGRLMLEAKPGVARRSSAAFPVMFLGMSLFLIGYMGKFFGDLIKAAVSRQREFLADASAVQFTRNPDGIAGALKRIGGHAAGSNIHRTGAEEFSHLFFSNGFNSAFVKMLATHPPLKERIQRIDPSWSGEFTFQLPVTEVPATTSDDLLAGGQGFAANMNPETVAATVGNPGVDGLVAARNILAQIPELLKEAVHEPYSVRAVVYLLFLKNDTNRRAAQLEILRGNADLFVRTRLRELVDQSPEISEVTRLPLLEMALPALRQLSKAEYHRLTMNLSEMQKVSQPITLSDWALGYYLTHHLREAFGADKRLSKPLSRGVIRVEIGYLLSVLAYSDRHKTTSAEAAFAAGQALLDFPVQLQPKRDISISRLEAAVRRLASLKPLQKPRILKAFVAVISADQKIETVEAELVRCFADAIDCPLPPIAI
jgi:Zn-dependent protease with chaperone function